MPIPTDIAQSLIDWAWSLATAAGALKLAMPILIPTTRQPALTREPRNLFLYGRTKVGKSSIASILPNSLHLDLEQGTFLIETRRVVVNTPTDLSDVIPQLTTIWQAAPFQYLIVDTIDRIEEWTDEVALADYRKLPIGQGKTAGITTVRELDRGAGFFYLREAFKRYLYRLLANEKWHTVFIGHIRDKYSDGSKLAQEVVEVDIDLAGKTKSIMCAKMDAIGYVFRDATGHLKLTFAAKDQVNCGCRSPYLAGKTFTFDTPAKPENWAAIYPDSWNKCPVPPPVVVAPTPVPTPVVQPKPVAPVAPTATQPRPPTVPPAAVPTTAKLTPPVPTTKPAVPTPAPISVPTKP